MLSGQVKPGADSLEKEGSRPMSLPVTTPARSLHTMEIRFQPALLQEVIDSFVEKTEREGDPTYYKEFHEYADPIYEKFMLEDREAEFKKLYQYLFGTWGFSDIVRDSFNEYPILKEKV